MIKQAKWKKNWKRYQLPVFDNSSQTLLALVHPAYNPEARVEANDMNYFNFFLQEMVHIASDFKDLFQLISRTHSPTVSITMLVDIPFWERLQSS